MLSEIKLIQENAELLFTHTEVDTAISKMAEKINLQLSDTNPVILCVMNGGVVVTGKLLPLLNFPCTFDAINASRYGNETSGTKVTWKQKPETDLKNRCVLIVDDILDEGLTMAEIINYCKEQGALSIYTAVLIDKKLDKEKPVIADFISLKSENKYLFGYGMDFKGYLRNAAGIYACKM